MNERRLLRYALAPVGRASATVMSGAWLRRKVRHPGEGGPHGVRQEQPRFTIQLRVKKVVMVRVNGREKDELP